MGSDGVFWVPDLAVIDTGMTGAWMLSHGLVVQVMNPWLGVDVWWSCLRIQQIAWWTCLMPHSEGCCFSLWAPLCGLGLIPYRSIRWNPLGKTSVSDVAVDIS